MIKNAVHATLPSLNDLTLGLTLSSEVEFSTSRSAGTVVRRENFKKISDGGEVTCSSTGCRYLPSGVVHEMGAR